MSVECGANNANRWHTDEIFHLIDVVKECGCIYNPTNKNYFCRPYVENLWRDIDIRFGKRPGASLSKWTNLRISFRREYSALVKKNTKPSWIFFEKMYFLQPFLRRKRPQGENLESHIQEALEQISSITRGNFKNRIENIERCEPEPSESEEVVEEEGVWEQNCLVKEEGSMDGHGEQIIYSIDTDDELVSDEMPENRDTDSVFSEKEEAAEQEESTQIYKRKSAEPEELFPSPKRERIDCNDQKSNATPSSVYPCECKSNPDAMFLLSLMPDIQLLSRKDKGKFKIEVQRIIQDLLYPDE